MTDRSSDQWSPDLYDDKHSFVWKLGTSVIELLDPKPGERILDVGCGLGQLTAQIVDSGAEVVGVDSSAAMIDEARRTRPDIEFQLGDVQCLDTASPFDAVFSNAALHWITQPDNAALCIARALKPTGRLAVEFGGQGNVQHLTAAVEAAYHSLLGEPLRHPWYFPSIAAFSSLLETHGMEVTFATLIDRPTPLEDDDGLRNWVRMFGQHWLSRIQAEQQDEFFSRVEEFARPNLFQNSHWFADYRRIRVAARKT